MREAQGVPVHQGDQALEVQVQEVEALEVRTCLEVQADIGHQAVGVAQDVAPCAGVVHVGQVHEGGVHEQAAHEVQVHEVQVHEVEVRVMGLQGELEWEAQEARKL